MGTKLARAPVCFAVAQVRFNTVLVLDRKLPEIQDAFRALGFPGYAPELQRTYELQHMQDPVSLQQRELVKHGFWHVKETASMMLEPSSLAFATSDYPTFEGFSAVFTEALKIVRTHLPVEYVEHVGMRMLDAVQPKPRETIDQYIIPEVLGLAYAMEKRGTSLEHQQTLSEAGFHLGNRRIVARAVRIRGSLAFPPDIQVGRMKIDPRFTQPAGDSVTLDTDGGIASRMPFDVEQIIASLRSIKSALTESFRASTTEFAMKAWS